MNLTSEDKTTMLETVTSKPAALDLRAVSMTMNLAENVLGDLLVDSDEKDSGGGSGEIIPLRSSKQNPITTKVGAIVSMGAFGLEYIFKTRFHHSKMRLRRLEHKKTRLRRMTPHNLNRGIFCQREGRIRGH